MNSFLIIGNLQEFLYREVQTFDSATSWFFYTLKYKVRITQSTHLIEVFAISWWMTANRIPCPAARAFCSERSALPSRAEADVWIAHKRTYRPAIEHHPISESACRFSLSDTCRAPEKRDPFSFTSWWLSSERSPEEIFMKILHRL